MSEEEIFEQFKKAVIEMDEERAKAIAEDALSQGVDPLDCIEKGLSEGMKVISEKFDNAEIFVPHILLAADTFIGAIDLLSPHIEGGYVGKGKVLIHTVAGDIHDIGKNIVAIMLEANGYEVIDLGRDVPVMEVVDASVENKVDFIAGSALMTTTMPAQREIMNELKDRGIREEFKCVFGGAPTTQDWIDEIGADGWA